MSHSRCGCNATTSLNNYYNIITPLQSDAGDKIAPYRQPCTIQLQPSEELTPGKGDFLIDD